MTSFILQLRCFLYTFLFAVSGFVIVKSFCKKKFKTDLMTSFILLLKHTKVRSPTISSHQDGSRK